MEAEIDIKPNRRLRLEVPSEKVFWERVQKPDGCWLYDGAKEINGYGYLQNPFADRPKFITAHRAAWIYTNGPIAEGMRVCHTCDIRSCINPAHLFLGTDQDNADDRVAKGRNKAGEKAWNAKLTEAQVIELRRRARAGANYRHLALEFGSSLSAVTCAINGLSWTYLTVEPPFRKRS